MNTFVRFTEDNDWEGERWDFWLQLTGNETELARFAALLKDTEAEETYELPYQLYLEDIESEAVVDKLVEYAMPGYMDSANKIVGKFTCPDTLGFDVDDLYKGGIHKFFKQTDA